MIQFLPVAPSAFLRALLEQIVPPDPAPTALPFRLPADYYSSPSADANRIVPRWIPFGCGAAALVFLLGLFAAGAFVTGGGGAAIIGFFFDTMQGDVERLFTPDVTPSMRADFEREWKRLETNMTSRRVPLDKFQGVLLQMQEAIEDKHVDGSELEKLTGKIRSVNEAVERKPRNPSASAGVAASRMS